MNGRPSVVLPATGLESKLSTYLVDARTRNPLGFKALSQRVSAATASARPALAGGGAMFAGRRTAAMDLDFADSRPVLAQALSAKLFDDLKFSADTIANVTYHRARQTFVAPANYAQHIIDALRWRSSPKGEEPYSAPQPTTSTPTAARELRLRLTRLKAIKRVGWEMSDFGDDTINCGGDGIDTLQRHIEVNQFTIHKFRRDGENHDISPDRTFVKFDLSGNEWPRGFAANVFLAEKDSGGGFITFLQELWEAIGDEVIGIASALAVAAAGAVVGAVVGTEIAPVVGTIIGAIVGAVISLLVSWFIDSLKDDILTSPDNPLTVLLESPQSRFPGGALRSPTYTQEFQVGSARYHMKYYWELTT